MTGSFERGVRLRWTHRDVAVVDLTDVELRFLAGAILEGDLIDEQGAPIASERVVLNFGWAGGPSDPLLKVFQHLLRSERNELFATTDESGRFRFAQVPPAVFFAFYCLTAESGFSYRVECTATPRAGSGFFTAPDAGVHRVVIRRIPDPVLRIQLHPPTGISGLVVVKVLVQQHRGQPLRYDSHLDQLPADGVFKMPIAIREGSQPSDLAGCNVRIGVFHPVAGASFQEFMVPTDTWTLHVATPATSGAPLSGRVMSADETPARSARLEVRSAFFGAVIRHVVCDDEGRWQCPMGADVPNEWRAVAEGGYLLQPCCCRAEQVAFSSSPVVPGKFIELKVAPKRP